MWYVEWPSREQWTKTHRAIQPVDDKVWRQELERRTHVEQAAIKPFFRLLREGNIVPSPELPLSNMLTAFFDYLEIEPSERPTAVKMDDMEND